MADSDIIRDGKEAYKRQIEAEQDTRDNGLEAYRFVRLDEHWPADIKAQRQKEGRPCLTIPRLGAFRRQVVNDARQNMPRIRVKPADDIADPKTALALDGTVRNIERQSNADAAYDTAIEGAVDNGFGYFRIDIEYAQGSFDQEIRINRIKNPWSVVGDCYSETVDSSDWNSAFVTSLIPKDEFEKLYKGASKTNWEADYVGLGEGWVDGDEIMIAEWWRREKVKKKLYKLSDGRVMLEDVYARQAELLAGYGIMPVQEREVDGYKVKQHLMTGAEVLNTVDWVGCFIPIVPVYGDEINIEGKRQFRSLLASAMDAQRRYNYWNSAATEIVALAPKTPFIGEQRAFELEPDKWDTANSRSHPYIAVPTGAPLPQRQPLDQGQAIGAISQALSASDDIKAILGMYDASLGAKSNETSGKAILARQREGDTSTFHFIDNLNRAIRHAGCIIVDLIPHVYTPGMIVRILGEDGKAQTAKLENRDPMAPKPQFGPFDEGMPQEHALVYDFGAGRYDVTVDSGPNYTTQREETVQVLTEVIRAIPAAAPFIGDKLAKALNIPDAEEISERLKAVIPKPQGEGLPPEVTQMIEQGKQIIAEQGKELEALKADKTLEAEKLKMEQFKAETERLKELLPYMTPESLGALGLQMNVQAMNTPDIAPGDQNGPQYNA